MSILSNILLIPGVGGDLDELRGLLFGNGQAGWMGIPSLDNTAIAIETFGSGVEIFRDLKSGSSIGPELVTNGTFDTDTAWTKGTGWTISGGVANFTATGSSSNLDQAESLVTGRSYLLTYTLTRSAGNFNSALTGGTSVFGPNRSSSGTYTEVLVAVAGNNNLRFTAGSTFSGTIDNVSVKELPGNPALQATSGSRSAWGRVPKRGRVNLFERTEELSNAYWAVATGTSATDNAQANPRTGSLNVSDVRETAITNFHLRGRSIVFPASTQHTMSCILSSNGRRFCGLNGGSSAWLHNAMFDLTNGTVFSTSASATASITRIGSSSYYYCTLTGNSSGSGGSSNCQIVLSTDGTTVSYLGDITKGVFASEMMLNTGTVTNYQRVVSAFDITEPGQPSCYYLQPDGVDDGYVTGSNLDLSGTDKVTVFAAVRKLSDAAIGSVVENPTIASDGTFALLAPNSATSNIGWSSKGTTTAAAIATGITSPATRIITGIGDISGDISRIRINGVQAAETLTDQGTGNYRNDVLAIFRRNAATLPFNGQCFALLVAGGSYSTATIQRVEQILSKYTPGVTL